MHPEAVGQPVGLDKTNTSAPENKISEHTLGAQAPEEVEALPRINSGRNSTTVRIKAAVPFEETPSQQGVGLEKKTLLTGAVTRNVASHTVSLVERPINKKHSGPDYYAKWVAFKSAGLPVVPTVRKSSRDSYLLTDVKADGSEVYGKGLSLGLAKGYRHRPHAAMDPIFLRLTEEKNFGGLVDQAARLADVAAANGIELPYEDAFELLVHPDGSGELITLDLRAARIVDDPDKDSIYDKNLDHAEGFLEILQALRERLLDDSIVKAS